MGVTKGAGPWPLGSIGLIEESRGTTIFKPGEAWNHIRSQ